MDVKTIRIIKASSPDREGLLLTRIAELKAAGFRILFDDITPQSAWTWTAGSVPDRAQALTKALLEPDSDAVMWARGGYGASDLLDLVPWEQVTLAPAKPIIGFSDVCAAQSALYTKTGRLSIHGPMPATSTWKKNATTDVDSLIAILKGKQAQGALPISPINHSKDHITGRLFGGCLSVLTSLIGTDYLPKNLAGHILYFEDVGENPGRILRMLNQWFQAGCLHGVKGLILGAFTDLGGELKDNAPILLEEIASRYQIPTFHTALFGHLSPNEPIVMGAAGSISGGLLTWSISPNTQERSS